VQRRHIAAGAGAVLLAITAQLSLAQSCVQDYCAGRGETVASFEAVPAMVSKNLPRKSLVIIIDDMGHSRSLGRQALALPGALNFAFLPHTPHGAELAQQAHASGKEVMLHAPMSNILDQPLGPGALTPDLSRSHFLARLKVALRDIPHVRGLNNHMGSELTQQRQPMEWVMEALAENGLYFVDSRTTAQSVAARTAATYGLPHLSRHVFLDNERSAEAISQRFMESVKIAERDGLAVVIGHPYQQTIDYLQQALPQLERRGISLIHASQAMGLPPAIEESTPQLASGALENNSGS
jgi:uncharacterized protein